MTGQPGIRQITRLQVDVCHGKPGCALRRCYALPREILASALMS